MTAYQIQKRLEELRREQNPQKYNPQRPCLRLPVPQPPPGWTPQPEQDDEDDESNRGVVVIDL